MRRGSVASRTLSEAEERKEQRIYPAKRLSPQGWGEGAPASFPIKGGAEKCKQRVEFLHLKEQTHENQLQKNRILLSL